MTLDEHHAGHPLAVRLAQLAHRGAVTDPPMHVPLDRGRLGARAVDDREQRSDRAHRAHLRLLRGGAASVRERADDRPARNVGDGRRIARPEQPERAFHAPSPLTDHPDDSRSTRHSSTKHATPKTTMPAIVCHIHAATVNAVNPPAVNVKGATRVMA
ncbi:MAG TPA: hypothetical protein VF200_01865 [Woeseiaceae bacterium]